MKIFCTNYFLNIINSIKQILGEQKKKNYIIRFTVDYFINHKWLNVAGFHIKTLIFVHLKFFLKIDFF